MNTKTDKPAKAPEKAAAIPAVVSHKADNAPTVVPDGHANDKSPIDVETPTAIETTAPTVLPSDSEGKDPKVVFIGVLGGQAPPEARTTIKQEVRELDEHQKADDLDDQLRTMRVLARTQGVDQKVTRGNGDVLVVFQDGTYTLETPVISGTAKASVPK